jgi:hypothetical protein
MTSIRERARNERTKFVIGPDAGADLLVELIGPEPAKTNAHKAFTV